MSKTKGNVLDPFRVIEHYGLDALRYYLLRDVRFGQDGAVSYDAVHERYHADLANDLGNLVIAPTAMVDRYRDGAVPAAATDAGHRRRADVERRRASPSTSSASSSPRRSRRPGSSVRALNRFVEEQAPWTLAKDPGARGELDVVARHAGRRHPRGRHPAAPASCPAPPQRMLTAVGAGDDTSWERAAPGRGGRRARASRPSARSSRASTSRIA